METDLRGVGATREFHGVPASFVRLAPGGVIIADLHGNEMLASRAEWLSLPRWHPAAPPPPHYLARSKPSANRLALLFALILVCEGIGFVRSLIAWPWRQMKVHEANAPFRRPRATLRASGR
jgi:hypothetical protein